MPVEYLRTAKYFTLVNDVKTHFVRVGRGFKPPIFLVHGFRGDHHGLLPISAKLQDFSLVVPDLPGFGQSDSMQGPHTLEAYADWLIEFIEQMDQDEFYLLGHSFGSLIVSKAVEKGLRPQKLILINPISSPALKGPKQLLSHLAKFYYFLGAKLPERLATFLLTNELFVRLMSEVMVKSEHKYLRRWIHRQHHQHFSSFKDRKSLMEAFNASISNTVPDFAHKIIMDTLLIAGKQDEITPLPAQLLLKNKLRSAELFTLDGTGHLIHYEKVSEAGKIINDFLNNNNCE